MTLFLECMVIVSGCVYFFFGMFFAMSFSIDMGKRGFKQFKRFVDGKSSRIFVLLLFAPWVLVSIITYFCANIVFFFTGDI